MVHGEFDGQQLQTLASEMRKTPAEVVALSEKVIDGYNNLVKQAVAAFGVPAQHYDEYLAWMQQHRPDHLHDARLQLTMKRSTAGFKELAKDFARNAVPSETELNANGFRTFRQNGHLMVDVRGQVGVMSAEALAKSGLLKRQ
jgi:uncharacterized short protein YbdD (DUF466 family)